MRYSAATYQKNCPNCLETYIPPAETLNYFKVREIDFERHKFYRGRGCHACRNTGYRGRIGIFELLTLNDVIRDAILMRKTSSEIRRLARSTVGILSMMEDGFYKSLKGVSTLEEVLRVIYNAESETWAGRTADEIIRACEGLESAEEMSEKSQSANIPAPQPAKPVVIKPVAKPVAQSAPIEIKSAESAKVDTAVNKEQKSDTSGKKGRKNLLHCGFPA